MLLRFAVVVTVLEVTLTALASVLVTYTDPPPGFATENDLSSLGLTYKTHENRRWESGNAPCYDTRATLSAPESSLFVSLRTDATPTDFEFRRSKDEVSREHPERGELVLINEPIPGEQGYAVRHSGPKSARFELVRFRRGEMLIVRVVRDKPFDSLPAAELARCERRARLVQEHLMVKLRWRD
ncbi:MAG TPA: hypothetical protein VKW04_04870 [Planctomycetota bacterium]|nr:hypothetical protein [Planctomycetota bacterium]